MREILFRGKRIDNREWIYGNLLVYPSGICKICVTTSKKPIYGQLEEVIPETVGQYTGLTDKNGTKIFEGDILAYDDSDGVENYVSVFFADGCFRYFEEGNDSDNELHNLLLLEPRVIGNIHDNPELSEAENGYKD